MRQTQARRGKTGSQLRTYGGGEVAAPDCCAQHGRVRALLPRREAVRGRPQAQAVRALRVHVLQRLLRRRDCIPVQRIRIAAVHRQQAGRSARASQQSAPLQ